MQDIFLEKITRKGVCGWKCTPSAYEYDPCLPREGMTLAISFSLLTSTDSTPAGFSLLASTGCSSQS